MPAEKQRLFFALKPTSHVAEQLGRAVESFTTRHAAHMRWTAASKYHLTLHFLGDHAGAAREIIDAATTAAEAVITNAFELTLHRIECFPGRTRVPWIVRLSPDSESRLLALRSLLGDRLVAAGLGELLEARFTPHVTIAYGPALSHMPIPITPIHWPVSEFALIQSRAGQAHYDTLGCWPLRGRLSVHAGESGPDNRPA